MAAKRGANIRIKRAYVPTAKADGARVLVDRLWPRGVTKDALAIERWVKEIGPSDELRRWFGHDPERWDEFRRRYAAELYEARSHCSLNCAAARGITVTLVYGARDEVHNNAGRSARGIVGNHRVPRKRKQRLEQGPQPVFRSGSRRVLILVAQLPAVSAAHPRR